MNINKELESAKKEERTINYKPFCNTEIIFSNKEELKQILLTLDETNLVLVMSESSVLRWNMTSFVDELKNKCKAQNDRLIWINNISANPTQKDIIRALKQIGEDKVEKIIAFGGGSGIDLAKGISAFYNKENNKDYTIEEITDSIKNKKYIKDEYVDIIAIPSTAGTGSEVTQWATIWDENGPRKFSVDAHMLKPKMAIIVPELTVSLPVGMTITTGLDAMCQAIEAYWSKHTTPIVQEIGYRAVELIIENLKNAIKYPNDIILREKLCRASVLSGLAFSQTRTTACHSISYPLTSLYNIPHGLAASITLEAIANINRGHFENDLALFGLFDEYNGIMNFIDDVCLGIIDMRLSKFGIREKDIAIIVENAFTGGRMDNNPVDLNEEDVTNILKSIM